MVVIKSLLSGPELSQTVSAAKRVGPVMVRQVGEIIPCFAIEPYHLGGLVPAIRIGAVAVKIAAVDLAVRAEQVSENDFGLPEGERVIAAWLPKV